MFNDNINQYANTVCKNCNVNSCIKKTEGYCIVVNAWFNAVTFPRLNRETYFEELKTLL